MVFAGRVNGFSNLTNVAQRQDRSRNAAPQEHYLVGTTTNCWRASYGLCCGGIY